jgi:DNA-binding transcriptional LysR family regulator
MADIMRGPGAPEQDEGIPERFATDLGSRITLRRLQVFWAVARFDNLTVASKQLGITQPSLSQQLANFEAAVGKPLFHRRSNRMILTDAGSYVLRYAEQVLGAVQKLEGAMSEIAQGAHQTLHVAGLSSVLRALMPMASQRLQATNPHVNYDLHEGAPAEILDLLYGRRISVGLTSANAISPASSGFTQIPIFEDPYVLAVPDSLRLEDVRDPARDLPRKAQEVLNRSIQFAFGTQHTQRLQAWYDSVIPDNWPYTQVRSFELALSMARAGLGVCLVPALTAATPQGAVEGVRLYRVDFPPRRIVALLPAHHARLQPHADLIAALQAAAGALVLPEMLETPPFLRSEQGC